jgi:MFS family permease
MKTYRPHDQKRTHRYLVDWEPNDPDNPRNFSTTFKVWITFQLGMLALAASLGSSIIAPAENVIAKYTNVSTKVSVLSISLEILGFASAPLCWASISEIGGRKWSMLPAIYCLGLFSTGTATSKNAASIFITRFFGGVFGSSPTSNLLTKKLTMDTVIPNELLTRAEETTVDVCCASS